MQGLRIGIVVAMGGLKHDQCHSLGFLSRYVYIYMYVSIYIYIDLFVDLYTYLCVKGA